MVKQVFGTMIDADDILPFERKNNWGGDRTDIKLFLRKWNACYY